MKAFKFRWNFWISMVLVVVASATVAHLLSGLPLFRLLTLRSYDVQFELRGSRPTGDIVLITADKKAFETFPEPQLFWHTHYAAAIRAAQIGGAKVIGLDLAFGIPVEQWVPGHDRMLMEAVDAAQIPVVMGFVSELTGSQRQAPFVVPVNLIAATKGNAAFANLTADEDDFIRRQELIESPQNAAPGEPLTRSLAMRTAERALGVEAVFEGSRLLLRGKEIPISDQRDIAINYAGPPGTFERISLADVEAAVKANQADQLKRWFANKVILVGSDAEFDRFSTPFFPMVGGGKRWTTAGVEIHANAVRTLLSGDFILAAPRWSLVLTLLLVAIGTYVSVMRLQTHLVAPAVIAIMGGGLVVSQGMFLARMLLPAPEIGLSWVSALVFSMVGRFVLAERRRDHFRKAVAVFVGKKVASNLEQTDEIGLTGTHALVTILFTDIRGFTAFCEDKDPAVIVDLLNVYMRQMVSIIVKHHGQVNKFIGDGIMAIFSDDDLESDTDHALRAVKCATEMVSAPSQFKTGAGIHTGLVVVGNVGSEEKMEYTVLGDAVNLASRLESLNKEKKTRLLLSGATRSFINDQMDLTNLGTMPVRGQSEPIHLYTVTSLLADAHITPPAESTATPTGASL